MYLRITYVIVNLVVDEQFKFEKTLPSQIMLSNFWIKIKCFVDKHVGQNVLIGQKKLASKIRRFFSEQFLDLRLKYD